MWPNLRGRAPMAAWKVGVTMDALAIIWPLVVVLIWAAVFGVAVLLVRMTTRDQQATVRAEQVAEHAAEQSASAPEPVGTAAVAAVVLQRAVPPLPAT
jgi:hypothetical protein